MRIVIDLQGAQTESRFRGIGRYSLSLAKAMARNSGEHEIIIALSGLFPDTIEPIRAEFVDLLPKEQIRVWNAPGPVRELEHENKWRRDAAELIREGFLASLQPDIVHISSLFEGYVDDAVTSIGRFDQTSRVSVSVYDLIPLLNPDQYLKPNPTYEVYYKRKIEQLGRSSLLLAISESSRQEVINQLGMDGVETVNISTAVDVHFRPITLSKNQHQDLQDKYGFYRSIVLYTGGADERKNLPRLIRAYAQLPIEIRNKHQLVLAGKMPEGEIHQLQHEADIVGLQSDELIFTGYVSDDELLYFYNLCKLYVFPSWHEGFGLPALEAMACGAAVIGANTSSLPEVIGNADALFDPFLEEAISEKIASVLTNEDFRQNLRKHGLEQANNFSWDKSAKRAITAYNSFLSVKNQPKTGREKPTNLPKLAFVSPLPPERSGIADYSAELLRELTRYYEIIVIISQDTISDPWIVNNCTIHNPEWLITNVGRIDRVLYHFGNSPFHQHMFGLLDKVPGTVVLHDFFLSSVQAYREEFNLAPKAFVHELYYAHGYAAVWERFQSNGMENVKNKYPTNLSILQSAQGVIVHSEYSKQLGKQWYGCHEVEDWIVIPLLRTPVLKWDRIEARNSLKLPSDAFILCSFGFLDATKLNDRLLQAWLSSNLAKKRNSILVFVGENHGGEYGQKLLDTVKRSGIEKSILITGWSDAESFRKYLAAADVAVQLRTLSRGETSAAVLDCMNHSLPTIVNANGSMADFSDDIVWKLPDEFSDEELIEALETLGRDEPLREKLGIQAREFIVNNHAPSSCADHYFEAIELFHEQTMNGKHALIRALATMKGYIPNDYECIRLAQSIAQSLPLRQPTSQILLDISATYRTDLKTGIERVARALILELIKAPPKGYRIEPVYLRETEGCWQYRYARSYTLGLLGCPSECLYDEPVETQPGEILLGLDLFGNGLVEAASYLDMLHQNGVTIQFLVFDLLPVLSPQFFPPGADEGHANWLKTICLYDGAICISKAVADELSAWFNDQELKCGHSFKISWFHLGADVKNSAPSFGIPDDASKVISSILERPSFLMVGTIEPRKGYGQAIGAFEKLWSDGVEVNLVLVGKEGWKGLPDEMRRTIPELINLIRNHPELEKRLFWLEGISDEYLEKIYEVSTCLIAASEGEGFGLPLIEAAQHKLPIIARDIPVFREVAGEHAYYFSGHKTNDLAQAVVQWLEMYKTKTHPVSNKISWLNWKQSAERLINIILQDSKVVNTISDTDESSMASIDKNIHSLETL